MLETIGFAQRDRVSDLLHDRNLLCNIFQIDWFGALRAFQRYVERIVALALTAEPLETAGRVPSAETMLRTAVTHSA
jgi:hypothetical protein